MYISEYDAINNCRMEWKNVKVENIYECKNKVHERQQKHLRKK